MNCSFLNASLMFSKAFFCTLSAMLCFAATGFAQQQADHTKLTNDEYRQLKAEGKLHVTPPPPAVFAPFDFAKAAAPSGGGGSVPVTNSADACGCYTPHDSSWTAFQTMPEYNGATDDGYAGPFTLPFSFCFYGQTITQYYININGNISFGAPYTTFSSNPFPDPSFVMVAPFWGDVDLGGAGNGEIWVKETPTSLTVNWEAVGYYNEHTDKLNTFSVVITDGTDPVLPSGQNVGFCYEDMQWTTGDASSGTNGFGGTPATVGANKGDGVEFVQFGRFDQAGNTFDGPFGNPDGVDWLDNKSFVFNVCSSTNIPPILTGLDLCDTLELCVGDTFNFDLSILSPENVQTTTAEIDTTNITFSDFTVVSNTSGISADIDAQLICHVADIGYHNLSISAWDNGTPADTIDVDIVVYIDSFPGFPVITGDTAFCSGDTAFLHTQNIFDDYEWSNGDNGDSLCFATTGGAYTVTVSVAGCEEVSAPFNVTENPSPTPIITGDTIYCSGNNTELDAGLPYDSLQWSNGSTAPNVFVTTGSYSVQVWENGCSGTSPTVNVQEVQALDFTIQGDTIVCEGSTVTLSAAPGFDTYNWSNGDDTQTITVSGGGSYVVTATFDICSRVSPAHTIVEIPASATITGPPGFCEGESTVLVANSGDSYLWSTGATTQVITVNAGGLYSVEVTTGQCTANSGNFTVAEYPAPTPTVLGATHYCYENLAMLEVQNPAQYDSLEWSSGAQTPAVQLPTGTYSVTVWDNNGCEGTYPDFTVTQSGPQPEVLPIPPFCPGENILIGILDTNGLYNYSWPIGQTTPTVTVPEGLYSVVVSDVFNCDTIVSFNLQPAPVPEAAIGVSPEIYGWLDESVQFTDNSTVASGSITAWDWQFGDGATADTQNPTHTYSEEGTVTIILSVTSNVGCTDDTQLSYRIVDEITATNVITPNSDGMNDQLTFKNLDLFPNSTLVIFDRWGREVTTIDNYQNDWEAPNRSDGVYFYMLEVPGIEPITGYVHVFSSTAGQ